jgi:hypothetical protein
LLGGRFMAWWGLLVAVAWLLQHLALTGWIGDGSGTIFGMIWLGFSIIGVTGQVILARTMGPRAGAGSAGNRASRSAWVNAAFAIGAVVVGAAIAASRGIGSGIFDLTVPVAFATYAGALIVTGSLSGDRTIMAAGAGAIAMAGVFTALFVDPNRYLAASAGAALTVLLPGLLLLAREPRSA